MGDQECWKPVVGAENYLVSSWGRVRNGQRLLKPFQTQGYFRVNLSGNQLFVHRLVAIAFLEAKPGLPVVAHLDGNPANNRLENLKWCTQKENLAHKELHGTAQRGEKQGHHILKEREVLEIVTRLNAGERPVDIAKVYGVKPVTISGIKFGRNWSYLTNINPPAPANKGETSCR